MKFKYYLRGLGIGITLTTLILMIAFAVNKDSIYSDEEIIRKATALGMVMPEEETSFLDTESDTQEDMSGASENDGSYDDADASGTDGNTEISTQVDTGVDDGLVTDNPQAASEVATDTGENTQLAETFITITIQKGDTSTAVAANLEKAGIVSDAASFVSYLQEHGLIEELEVGTFEIPSGADMDEIAYILTTNEYEKTH